VTRQGQRPDQPVPFSHKHHVEGLGLQCQYCHVGGEVELRGHSADQDLHELPCADLDQRSCWSRCGRAGRRGASIQWTKVHDLPDYVYFNHEIHVNKGMGCASCHGRVDEMPLMYQQNTLQMEWCLNCHRNPAEESAADERDLQHGVGGPSSDKPVWCAANGEQGGPTAQSVSCTTKDPGGRTEVARCSLNAVKLPGMRGVSMRGDDDRRRCRMLPVNYRSSPARMSWVTS
jgi:hypothetical protein